MTIIGNNKKYFTAHPSQPQNVMILNLSTTWIYISWEAPLVADSYISHYVIMANAVTEGMLITANVTVGNDVILYNVTGLLPGTTYELTVLAVSQRGDVIAQSQPSVGVQGTTAAIIGEMVPDESRIIPIII